MSEKSSTMMISLRRCGGERSRMLCTVRSKTDQASLWKHTTTLVSGRLSRYFKSRHLVTRQTHLKVMSEKRNKKTFDLQSLSKKQASSFIIFISLYLSLTWARNIYFHHQFTHTPKFKTCKQKPIQEMSRDKFSKLENYRTNTKLHLSRTFHSGTRTGNHGT